VPPCPPLWIRPCKQLWCPLWFRPGIPFACYCQETSPTGRPDHFNQRLSCSLAGNNLNSFFKYTWFLSELRWLSFLYILWILCWRELVHFFKRNQTKKVSRKSVG
jgi:hypothetical protein